MLDRLEAHAYPENLDLALDLGHAHGAVNVAPAYQFYGDLLAPLAVQTELDLAKLALADGLEKQVGTKFGDGSPRVGCSIGNSGRVRVHVAIARLIIGCLVLMLRGDDLVGGPLSPGRGVVVCAGRWVGGDRDGAGGGMLARSGRVRDLEAAHWGRRRHAGDTVWPT